MKVAQLIFEFNRYPRLLILILFLFVLGCDSTMRPVSFDKLQLPSSPNYALVASENYSPKPTLIAPVFPIAKEALAKQAVAIVLNQPRTKLLSENWAELRFQFMQRTKWMRFPDYIDVQFIEQDNGSSFIMFSRSKYGYSDLGANAKRMKQWLADIQQQVTTD